MFLPKTDVLLLQSAFWILDKQVNRSDLSDAERERHNELTTARSSAVYCQVGTVGWHSHTCRSMGESPVGICCAVLMFDTSGTISELKQAPGNDLQIDLAPKVKQTFFIVGTLCVRPKCCHFGIAGNLMASLLLRPRPRSSMSASREVT